MKILGISVAHDSSACLYEDGKIISFYKEERLTGKKRDNNPITSIIKCLDGVDTLDAVAFCSPQYHEPTTKEYTTLVKKLTSVENIIDFSENHHLQHAGLAFYNSGFDEAAVLIIDRNGAIFFDGARECETIFHAKYPHDFKEIYKSCWVYDNISQVNLENFKRDKNPECEYDLRSMYGIVKVYETATAIIKQPVLENGKTMGLSAYGDKALVFPDLFVNSTNIPNDYYFSHEWDGKNNYQAINLEKNYLQQEVFDKSSMQPYADYAWQVQKQTQEAACHLIQKAIDKTGCKNIVISGGYGLNVVANSYYIKKFPDINFYFEPLADDTGNSIGGAMIAYRILTKDMTKYPIQHTFYQGKKHNLDHINGKHITTEEMCDKLLQQKSVAIYKGLAEAGPRALGNRSILFDARNKNAVDIVNKIKKREWYRPFAAIVLQEDAELYFDMLGVKQNKFMTMSFEATEYAKEHIPGIIHVDNSCRIQTIDESDGVLYDILRLFKQKTGVSVLLNTSFNLAGRPLVDSPEDAIYTLYNSTLDYLWFPEKQIVISNE